MEPKNKTLKTQITFDKCDKCGIRRKAEGKKWCQRCIDRYKAVENKPLDQIEARIAKVIPELYREASLADLSDDIVTKISERLESQDVFLWGSPGTGKTHATAAFLRHYIENGFSCYRFNFDDFCCRVRSTMGARATVSEWDLVESVKDVDVLAIDDLGLRSKQETDFAYVTLYSILNKRQEKMLPTFISTNKTLEQLRSSFDQRIVSRLESALKIEIKGIDRRLAK